MGGGRDSANGRSAAVRMVAGRLLPAMCAGLCTRMLLMYDMGGKKCEDKVKVIHVREGSESKARKRESKANKNRGIKSVDFVIQCGVGCCCLLFR